MSSAALAGVDASMALAIIDEAKAKGYRRGIIGLRGNPTLTRTEERTHRGEPVRIRPAVSALAAREHIIEARGAEGWTAIVTDRSEEDLGAGICAHLVWARLRSPDAWDAVRAAFGATGLDQALITTPHQRELAAAVLHATPSIEDGGWPVAAAGVLTRDHLMRAVAERHLGFDANIVDTMGLMRWSMQPDVTARIRRLRDTTAHILADETLRWMADLTGAAAPLVNHLLGEGRVGDLVPVALTLNTLDNAPAQAETHAARSRLDASLGLVRSQNPGSRALGLAAVALIEDDLTAGGSDRAHAALERTDVILRDIGASALAADSTLLRAGLDARLAVLARAMERHARDPLPDHLIAVENAWAATESHRDRRALGAVREPVEAGVRLCRWLAEATPDAAVGDAAFVHYSTAHLRDWSWADAAINDASVGVTDPQLSDALGSVIDTALARRVVLDRMFARALADVTARAGASAHAATGVSSAEGSVFFLEHVLPDIVIPLARETRALMLVLDGMSAAAANEIITDVTNDGWVELAIDGGPARAAAVAVLPTLTEVSRCSLLSGRLEAGDQTRERKNFAALLTHKGITGALFHKKDVDTLAFGARVAEPVATAIDGDDHLIAIVLNTIDDALDRSDPGGTHWGAAEVKHLKALLERARAAGRAVIITADHGHVIERRVGKQRSYPDMTSGRSRTAPSGVSSEVAEDEIAVAGRRVVDKTGADAAATLAVDEGLRYGPLKAGYHGGASAAEVIVPVIVLAPVNRPLLPGPQELGSQGPSWWVGASAVSRETPSAVEWTHHAIPGDANTLFTATEQAEERPADVASKAPLTRPVDEEQECAIRPGGKPTLGSAVVSSAIYVVQVERAGRVALNAEQLERFIDEAAARGGRMRREQLASTLGIHVARLGGAVAQLQRLLNVEGYPIVRMDPVSGIIELDTRLLAEQFEVAR
ncbi:BREX-2 system phosphatase PglZ [Dermacoccus sp. BD5]|uniref:BREX-2 system phosphatase PglZ n=1 Tax=Dermacoccus sp. BD5 TaxID=2953656 RepID=UPI003846AFA6